jgi:hypothetical protein
MTAPTYTEVVGTLNRYDPEREEVARAVVCTECGGLVLDHDEARDDHDRMHARVALLEGMVATQTQLIERGIAQLAKTVDLLDQVQKVTGKAASDATHALAIVNNLPFV